MICQMINKAGMGGRWYERMFPEKVMFESNIMDMKKQVIGRNKGKTTYAEGTANGEGFR